MFDKIEEEVHLQLSLLYLPQLQSPQSLLTFQFLQLLYLITLAIASAGDGAGVGERLEHVYTSLRSSLPVVVPFTVTNV